MTRTGKIARLPFTLRDELNEKIRDGKPGVEIVAWLNGQDAVKRVLNLHFEGRPISEQNLTEWKAGGYPDWLRHSETTEWVTDFVVESDHLADEAERGDHWTSLADCLSAPLAVELARSLKAIAADQESSARERLQSVLAITRAATQLRRADHSQKRERWRAEWAGIEREDRMEVKRENDERRDQTNRAIRTMYYEREAEHAERMEAQRRAERRRAAAAKPPKPNATAAAPKPVETTPSHPQDKGAVKSSASEAPGEEAANQGKSNQIPVNPGISRENQAAPQRCGLATGMSPLLEVSPCGPDTPDQGKSNQIRVDPSAKISGAGGPGETPREPNEEQLGGGGIVN